MEPLNITFGVEIEFLIVSPQPCAVYHAVTPQRADVVAIMHRELDEFQRRNVIQELRKLVPVNDYAGWCQFYDSSKWTVDSDGSVRPTVQEKWASALMLASGRVVGSLETIREDLIFTNCEVKSRVLPWSQKSLNEVAAVVALLRDNCLTYVNQNCGVHVHVGNGEESFPLTTVQNLCTLICCFEHQINQIHPPERVMNFFCKLNSGVFGPELPDRWEMAAMIDSFKDLEGLIAFMNIDPTTDQLHKQWAVNLLNLIPSTPRAKTVEFRQARGSLDPDEIIRWVQLVATIVSLSHTQEVPFNRLMLLHSGMPVLGLLREMNLGWLADEFEGHTYIHDDLDLDE